MAGEPPQSEDIGTTVWDRLMRAADDPTDQVISKGISSAESVGRSLTPGIRALSSRQAALCWRRIHGPS